MQQEKRIDALTGARFVAIILIVFSHFSFFKQHSFGYIYDSYLNNPTIGVDFFFMLSGFGMMLSSLKRFPDGNEKIGGIRGLFDYGKKHIEKIYKVYFFTLLTGIPYAVIVTVMEKGEKITQSLINIIKQFILCTTLLQSLTGRMRYSHALNGVCWFLSTLFCIYLISPIIMKILKRAIKNLKSALWGIIITIFFSYALAILFEYIDQTTRFDDLCYGSPYRRVFYVMCGMIVAQIYMYGNFKGQIIFEYVSISMALVWFFVRNSIFDKLGALSYVVDMIICASVLYALAIGKGKISKALGGKKWVYLGDISMYIFITHYIIKQYIVLGVKILKIESMFTSIVEMILILSLTLLISAWIDGKCRWCKNK